MKGMQDITVVCFIHEDVYNSYQVGNVILTV